MELNGDIHIDAARDRVWRALNDPQVLVLSIPGCEEVQQVSPTETHVRVLIKMGPVRARFVGKILMSEVTPDEGCVLAFEGSGGAAGFARGSSTVRLEDEGAGTRLRYTAQATVGGKLGQIGGRMIDAAAKQTADQFFTAFGEHLGLADRAAPGSVEAAERGPPAADAPPAPPLPVLPEVVAASAFGSSHQTTSLSEAPPAVAAGQAPASLSGAAAVAAPAAIGSAPHAASAGEASTVTPTLSAVGHATPVPHAVPVPHATPAAPPLAAAGAAGTFAPPMRSDGALPTMARPSAQAATATRPPAPPTVGEGVRILWFALGAAATGFGVAVAAALLR